jgi:hypothetical protein
MGSTCLLTDHLSVVCGSSSTGVGNNDATTLLRDFDLFEVGPKLMKRFQTPFGCLGAQFANFTHTQIN